MGNELNLNGSKCKLMTFFRVSPHYTTYTLSGWVLDRITHAEDLGVYMDPKLKFSDHITTMDISKDGRRNSMIPISQRPYLFY